MPFLTPQGPRRVIRGVNRVAHAVVVVTNAHRCCMLTSTGELCWRNIVLVGWVVQRTVTVTVTVTVILTVNVTVNVTVTVLAIAACKCIKAYTASDVGIDLLDAS